MSLNPAGDTLAAKVYYVLGKYLESSVLIYLFSEYGSVVYRGHPPTILSREINPVRTCDSRRLGQIHSLSQSETRLLQSHRCLLINNTSYHGVQCFI